MSVCDVMHEWSNLAHSLFERVIQKSLIIIDRLNKKNNFSI